MRILLVILSLIFSLFLGAQNLVPNPSFEDRDTIPCSWVMSQYEFISSINNWTIPTKGSADIFSTTVEKSCYSHCFSTSELAVGHQQPRSGEVMSCIFTYGKGCGNRHSYREYLEVKLTRSLTIGQEYYAEVYVSFAEFSMYATNNIGMHFSDTLVNQDICQDLKFEPQINEENIITDGENWVRISGTFIAETPARYLIIGNFFQDSRTEKLLNRNFSKPNGRYFIDDVLVQVN